MTKDDLAFVIATMEDLSVDAETHSWGPSYHLAQQDKQKALKMLRKELKEKNNGNTGA